MCACLTRSLPALLVQSPTPLPTLLQTEPSSASSAPSESDHLQGLNHHRRGEDRQDISDQPSPSHLMGLSHCERSWPIGGPRTCPDSPHCCVLLGCLSPAGRHGGPLAQLSNGRRHAPVGLKPSGTASLTPCPIWRPRGMGRTRLIGLPNTPLCRPWGQWLQVGWWDENHEGF